MTWHSQTPEQIAGQLGSDLEKGLSPSQAADLLGRVGENKLQGKKPKTLLQRFLAQLKDTMVIILMLAAVVSTIMAFVDEHGDFLEPVVIVGIVLLNACLGVAQESKAEKALEALKDMSTPTPGSSAAGRRRSSPPPSWCPATSSCWRQGTLSPPTPG